MNYFRIVTDNLNYPDQWFLDDPITQSGEEIDGRLFSNAERYRGPVPYSVPVRRPGTRVAFTLASIDMPVVSAEVANAMQLLAKDEIERFPVLIQGRPGYEILNATCSAPCLDEARSLLTEWTEEDGRPDKVGTPKMILKLIVDPAKARGCHILRVQNWKVALLVSETLKRTIQKIPQLGVRFILTSAGAPAPTGTMDHHRFYQQLFAALPNEFTSFDEDAIVPLVGFDSGGPLSFRTIGREHDEKFVTYISNELAVRPEQRPSEFGRYELMAICDDEDWVRSILSRIGRMSLDVRFGCGHTLDIGDWVEPNATIQGVLFEPAAIARIDSQNYAVLRCIGITRSELKYAQVHGPEKLLSLLKEAEVYPRTTCTRQAVV